MNRNYYLIFVVLLAGSLLGLVACGTEEPAEATPETATTAAPVSDVNDVAVGGFGSVSAEGEVVPLSSAELSFQLGGNVAEIMVAEGDTLSAGEPIMRLDSEALENGLRQAAAGLDAAEAAYEAAVVELDVAKAGVRGRRRGDVGRSEPGAGESGCDGRRVSGGGEEPGGGRGVYRGGGGRAGFVRAGE